MYRNDRVRPDILKDVRFTMMFDVLYNKAFLTAAPSLHLLVNAAVLA